MNSNILLRIDWGQLRDRPFVAEVWGTVSDWVMVSVTSITAVYLIKTFLEQKKFNKEQADLSKLQRRQRLKSIRPYFIVSEAEEDRTLFGRPHRSTYLRINLNGANAYNVTISNLKNPQIPDAKYEFIAQNVGLEAKFLMTSGGTNFRRGFITGDFELGSINGDQILNLLLINFEDEDGNAYYQRLDYKDNGLVFSKPVMKRPNSLL